MRYLLLSLTIAWSVLLFSQEDETMVTSKDSIVEFINCPAEFPGGTVELVNYIRENINYEDIDLTKFDYGTLYITFWVEADSSITGIDITNRDRESILKKNASPFESMPKWSPACDEKGPVRDKVWIPVIIDVR